MNVWASGPFGMAVCGAGSTAGGSYPDGSSTNQYGWDLGLTFENTNDLAEKISVLSGSLQRLAIEVHGTFGEVDLDGKMGSGALGRSVAPGDSRYTFNITTFDQYKGALLRVAGKMAGGSTVLFMGCTFGGGIPGSDMLKRISKEIFINSKVVGFINMGITGQVMTLNCYPPGMKITDIQHSEALDQKTYQEQLVVVKAKPWASEASEEAKVAIGGQLIKDPERISGGVGLNGYWNAETPAKDVATAAEKFIIWFSLPDNTQSTVQHGKVWWNTHQGFWDKSKRVGGTYSITGSTLTFQFDEGGAGNPWQRVWTAPFRVGDGGFASGQTIIGGVAANGQTRGQFRMTKNDSLDDSVSYHNKGLDAGQEKF